VRLFEERSLLQDLLARTTDNATVGGVQVLIGGEGKWEDLKQCSVVLARYGIPGLITGTLACLGPMRMPYGRTIPTVRFMADLLSGLVSESMAGEEKMSSKRVHQSQPEAETPPEEFAEQAQDSAPEAARPPRPCRTRKEPGRSPLPGRRIQGRLAALGGGFPELSAAGGGRKGRDLPDGGRQHHQTLPARAGRHGARHGSAPGRPGLGERG